MTAPTSHFPIEIGELAGRLADRATELVRDILPGGARRGSEWLVASADSPLGCAISVHLTGSKAGVWGAWAASKGGDALDLVTAVKCTGDKRQAIRWALAWLSIEPLERRPATPAPAPASKRPHQAEPNAEEKRGAAFRLWLAGTPLRPGDAAYDYLADTRGIDLAALGRLPRALRYFRALTNTEAGRRFPALLAAVIGPRGRFLTVHRTWLERQNDGRVLKAPVAEPKKVYGPCKGGIIPLWRGASGQPWKQAPPGDVLGLAEGIEDALSYAVAVPEHRVAAALIWRMSGCRRRSAPSSSPPTTTRPVRRPTAHCSAPSRTSSPRAARCASPAVRPASKTSTRCFWRPADMARKRLDHLREVVNNAQPVKLPSDDGAGNGEGFRRQPPPSLPPGCPVIPVGAGDGVRYYLNGLRQLVSLKIKEHTRLEIMGLFGEDADLVHDIWPRKKTVADKNGETREVVTGWRPEDAGEQLMRLAAVKGLWSPTEKARGRGCWLGADGSLMVNAGTSVFVDGAWQRPGLFGDHVLVARDPIMKPSLLSEPGGAARAAAEILELLQTWNWKRPIDARLLLGWLVCAFYGAALPIRPVGWLLGPRNTGKSTLQTAIAGLAGGWLMSVLDPTPAAIWQTLKHDCLAVGIDEAEVDEDKDNRRRLNELVRLARLCFSGGKLPRGGSDGEASEYSLRSSVLFSSINPPPLLPQDRSRIIMMRLAKLPAEQRLPDVSAPRLRALGARLLSRAVNGWPRLAAALEQYRIALKAAGHEGRSIEVFGTALAAADIVLSDHEVDSDSAAELAAQLDFATLAEAEDDLPDEQAWLNHLLSCVIPLDGVGGRNTIAGWLRAGTRFADLTAVRDEADQKLGYYGLKIIRARDGGAPEHFAIANRHQGLERLHAGTHWAGRSGAIGGWKNAARDLDGTQETTQRFAGTLSKGTAIPLRLIFPGGYDDDAPPARGELPLRVEP